MDHPRRVLLISTNYPPQVGGVEQVVSHLAHYLVDRGARVTVVTSRSGTRFWGPERADGVDVHRLFLGIPGAGWRASLSFPLLGPLSLIYLIGLVLRRHPELIHLHFADNATAYALVLAQLFSLPLVVSLHGDDVEELARKRRFHNWLLQLALRRAAVVTGCSRALLDQARRPEGFVVANGVRHEWLRMAPGVSENGYILTVARLVPKKGVDDVIRAIAVLPPRHTNLRLKVAGDGPERGPLEALSVTLGLSERVEFLGRIEPDDVRELVARCRLFALGSRREPFGIVLLEALAVRRPVVATNVGGVPEIIENGVHGLLVPPNEPDALAASITQLLDDPTLAATLAGAGQERVRAHFGLSSQMEHFWTLYEDVLAARAR